MISKCYFVDIKQGQGSYKKLNLKFKNIQEHFWGENKFVQEHFRHVIRTFYLQYLLSTEPFRPVKQSRSQKLVL